MAAFTIDNTFLSAVIGKDLAPIDPAALEGKTIGLYFSAHWCGPCRSFTPQLAKKYEEIVAAGHPFEIIFVSADESEEDALEYFKDMPWKMISFENRDLESKLSQQFEVRGIPTLVLLDANGKLMTNEGRNVILTTDFENIAKAVAEKEEKEKRFLQEVAEHKAHFNPVTFFQDRKVIDRDGNSISGDHLAGKIVGIYFSAHWCPPCRGFTPKLATKYNDYLADNKPFEIIFVSSDRDDASAAEYFQEMPWKMLSFEDRESKQLLASIFEVSGIPSFVLVNEAGIITEEGRDAIMSVSCFEKLTTFAEDRKAEEARLAEEILLMAEEVTVLSVHPHPLKKLPSVYRGSYGCDHCGGGGNGWVYHCDECGFDVHPTCVQKLLKEEESAAAVPAAVEEE